MTLDEVDVHSNAASCGPTSSFLLRFRMLLNAYALFISIQFIIHFHQAVLENNLAEIAVPSWNKYPEIFYAGTE